MPISTLPISKIIRDAALQVRVKINAETVREYEALYRDGATLPAPVVYTDGTSFWLADGFQRVAGAEGAGRTQLDWDVRKGTFDDALLYAAGANATHGLPMTNADKRRAVQVVLEHKEAASWSDRQIARHCGVSGPFVANVRKALGAMSPDVRVGADGRKIKTAKIGRRNLLTENRSQSAVAIETPATPTPVPSSPAVTVPAKASGTVEETATRSEADAKISAASTQRDRADTAEQNADTIADAPPTAEELFGEMKAIAIKLKALAATASPTDLEKARHHFVHLIKHVQKELPWLFKANGTSSTA